MTMSVADQQLYTLAFNVLAKAEKDNDVVSLVIARAVIVALADKNAIKTHNLSQVIMTCRKNKHVADMPIFTEEVGVLVGWKCECGKVQHTTKYLGNGNWESVNV